MKFRPCIDLHEGVVKQIVGSSLTEDGEGKLAENFVSTKDASHYARMYQQDQLFGGHVIMLGKGCEEPALRALQAFPGGLQIGGGITVENALKFLDAGAAQVIVTSAVFNNGSIDWDTLTALKALVGRERLVVDLSCRRKPESDDGVFYVVTNKWTKFTDFPVNLENLYHLSTFCAEFLIHGVEVEGKRCGIEHDLVRLLGEYRECCVDSIPVTYAGGVRSMEDLVLVQGLGRMKVDCTVGSALDCFGGDLSYDQVVAWHRSMN